MNVQLPLDGTARDAVRPASKAVFGHANMLEVMAGIAGGDGRTYQAQLAKLASCEPNQVSACTKRLVAGGLLVSEERAEGQTRDYLRRIPSPLWSFAHDLLGQLVEAPNASVQVLPTSA